MRFFWKYDLPKDKRIRGLKVGAERWWMISQKDYWTTQQGILNNGTVELNYWTTLLLNGIIEQRDNWTELLNNGTIERNYWTTWQLQRIIEQRNNWTRGWYLKKIIEQHSMEYWIAKLLNRLIEQQDDISRGLLHNTTGNIEQRH